MMCPERNFDLEREVLWNEIRDRLVWGDQQRVRELFTLLTNTFQDDERRRDELQALPE